MSAWRVRHCVGALLVLGVAQLVPGQGSRGGRGGPPFDRGGRGGPPSFDRGAGSDDGRDGFASGDTSIIRLEGGGVVDENTVRTARETASHSTGTPEWKTSAASRRMCSRLPGLFSARTSRWAAGFAAAGAAG